MTETKSVTNTKTATNPSSKIKVENDKLKKDIEKMKEDLSKMSDLEEQIKKMSEFISNTDNVNTNVDTNKNIVYLNADEEVTVISQCMGGLTLATEGMGQGVLYEFSKFGEIQDIPYSDLKDIVKNNRGFAQEGLFYIINDAIVDKLRLKSYYNRMISNEDMLNLFSKNPYTIIELYKLASDGQKEVIIDMIVDKKLKGEDVDANVLIRLGSFSKKDLINIEAVGK